MAKKQPKKVKKKKEESNIDRNEKQVKYLVISMILALVIVLVAILLANSTRDFEYRGFTFERFKQGGDLYYVTYIKTPVKDFALALKNDPRTLDNIPVEATVVLFTNKLLYVSLDDKIPPCEFDGVSLVQFGRFASAIGMDVKAGSINETVAKEYGMAYKTCENVEDNEIALVFLDGEETKISQEKDNCYVIDVKECELPRATEKFMLEVISQAPEGPK